ncbi:MAG: tRNA (adenosine(37)-N6)-threonylcarbamoyltransferase complex dimerization subunit type 1 TsaB [Tepidiformaceae bacterium]
MTTVLCIDTASTDFALALARDGHVVRSFARDGAQDHSRLLLAAIQELLGDDAPDAVAAVRGPGSYAGLRVGLATAQGLALARALPIAGVGTMEAIAATQPPSAAFTAIHPAGRGNFAAQKFRDGLPAGDLFGATAEDLAGLALVGEGAAVFGGLEVTPEARCRAALLLALPRLKLAGPSDVEAIYLREPNITMPRKRPPAPSQPR